MQLQKFGITTTALLLGGRNAVVVAHFVMAFNHLNVVFGFISLPASPCVKEEPDKIGERWPAMAIELPQSEECN